MFLIPKQQENKLSNKEEKGEKEYNVTIYFAGKDVTLKVIAKDLIKIIPPNKYVGIQVSENHKQ